MIVAKPETNLVGLSEAPHQPSRSRSTPQKYFCGEHFKPYLILSPEEAELSIPGLGLHVAKATPCEYIRPDLSSILHRFNSDNEQKIIVKTCESLLFLTNFQSRRGRFFASPSNPELILEYCDMSGNITFLHVRQQQSVLKVLILDRRNQRLSEIAPD